MVKVKRLNVELDIEDELVQEYLQRGFSVIGNKGKVIKEGIPNDLPSLRKKYIEQKKIIEQLEKQVKELQSQLALLQEAKIEFTEPKEMPKEKSSGKSTKGKGKANK